MYVCMLLVPMTRSVTVSAVTATVSWEEAHRFFFFLLFFISYFFFPVLFTIEKFSKREKKKKERTEERNRPPRIALHGSMASSSFRWACQVRTVGIGLAVPSGKRTRVAHE